jgi:secondary thiamine-phosphate synthase enzyme
MWLQRELTLEPLTRGFHLVTREVLSALPELRDLEVGLLHLLIRHTSASLTLNENASPDVRRDFEAWFDEAVPERSALWTHTLEGSDDMPAHIKASLLGPSLTLPISGGGLRSGHGRGSTYASTVTAAARGRWSRPFGVRRWSSGRLRRSAPVAQLDRASVYGTEGREFESLRARRSRSPLCGPRHPCRRESR